MTTETPGDLDAEGHQRRRDHRDAHRDAVTAEIGSPEMYAQSPVYPCSVFGDRNNRHHTKLCAVVLELVKKFHVEERYFLFYTRDVRRSEKITDVRVRWGEVLQFARRHAGIGDNIAAVTVSYMRTLGVKELKFQ